MKVISTLGLSLLVSLLQAQNHQLSYHADKWPIHEVVHFSKANWDGTNQGFVSIYFKDHEWIEALKWHEGHAQATIVPAKINHQTFNVNHFKNIRCQEGTCNQLGEMYWEPAVSGFILQLGDQVDTLTNVPDYWHSYDFDFSSLMVAVLFKNNFEAHSFQRADFQQLDGNFVFGPMGKIEMTPVGEKTFKDSECFFYAIDGPGLQHRGGEIWFDRQTMLLKGFKIQEPDESSYNSVDYRYLSQQQMSPEQWESFKRQKY